MAKASARTNGSPWAGIAWASDWPSTYSIDMKSTPCSDPISYTVTMFGWFKTDAARASLINCCLRFPHLPGAQAEAPSAPPSRAVAYPKAL